MGAGDLLHLRFLDLLLPQEACHGLCTYKVTDCELRYHWHDVFFGKILNRVWRFMFVATWSMCFGYQFYHYSYFFQLFEVDNNWGLAQVVAITVWVPSLVEYGILDICKLAPTLFITFRLTSFLDGIVEGTAYTLAAPLTVTQGKSASSVDASSEDDTTEIPPYARLFSHGKTF